VSSGLAATAFAPAAARDLPDALIALERSENADFCRDQMEFLDGYFMPVEANGDNLTDYLVNTGQLMCDGTQMMWCGTIGCVHRIWLQKPDGSFEKALESYAYEITFDRPGDPSFVVATRGGRERSSLVAARDTAADDADTTAGDTVFSAPADRWAYRARPAPVAATGPAEAHLSLTCEAGGLRLRYSAWWLFDGDEISTHAREWEDRGPGIVPTFAVGRDETDVPVGISEDEKVLVADDLISPDARLVAALERGRNVIVHHGGSLEHMLEYPLKGSSAALRALRAACRS
jgi:hypothetical protein